MQIVCREQQQQIALEHPVTLDTMLELLTELAGTDLISGLVLNGEPLPPDWDRQAGCTYLMNDDVLELHLTTRADAWLQVDREHSRISAELSAFLVKTAHLYRLGMLDSANADYARCLDMLQDFLHMEETRGNFSRLLGLATKTIDMTVLDNLLQELSQAQERQDWLYLADLLEYDLVGLTKN